MILNLFAMLRRDIHLDEETTLKVENRADRTLIYVSVGIIRDKVGLERTK